MKKGPRFQTKLMLAFLLATSLVSVAIIDLTSQKVRRTYQRQFRDQFQNQVDFILKARDRRTESQLELGKRLAKSGYIVSLLKHSASGNSPSSSTAPRREFFEKLNSLFPAMASRTSGAPKGKGTQLSQIRSAQQFPYRFLAVADLEGEITEIDSAANRKGGRLRAKSQRDSIFRLLEGLVRNEEQQIAYLPFPGPEGKAAVRDVTVTPVKDPESGEALGAFLMSFTSAETGAEKFIGRYQEEIGGGHFENAIFLEGKLYPSRSLGSSGDGGKKGKGKANRKAGGRSKAHSLEGDHFEEVEKEMAASVTGVGNDQGSTGNFEADIGGIPHFVHYCAINPDSPLATAWQVSAFPLTDLKRELKDLRIKGGGVGLIGILFGSLLSWFFSRNLAVPIGALSEGTRAIREGQFDTRLPVRSRDEVGELTDSFNQMAEELQLKDRYRSLLEKVSDESVAQAMIEGQLNPELGGELKDVSVLFCDIRGFTSLAEAMRPEEVIELLNLHMTAMTAVVREHFGVVDKFVGDEIMAVFGGIKSYGNDALHAVKCALKMIGERDRLNETGQQKIEIGIGIATGEVVAGCMGSEDRLNYTVLGGRVNLGARLCGAAQAGQVIVDDETFRRIEPARPVAEKLEPLQLKGIDAPVEAWKLAQISEPLHEEARTEPEAIPISGQK